MPNYTIELPINIIDTSEFKRKYWNKVCRIGKSNEDCWLWNSVLLNYKSKYKVPYVQIERIKYQASRISYYFGNNVDPGGLNVLHRCDNSLCMNFNHMFLGTHEDNRADCVEKNRQAKGEIIGTSKLTEEDIKDIRELYKIGRYSHRKLGLMFDTTYSNIRFIVTRQFWKHVVEVENG